MTVEVHSSPVLLLLLQKTSSAVAAELPEILELSSFNPFGISLKRVKGLLATHMTISYQLIKNAPLVAIESLLQREFARSRLKIFHLQNWLRDLAPRLEHISNARVLKLMPRFFDPAFFLFWPICVFSRRFLKFVDETVDGIVETRLAGLVEKETIHNAVAILMDRNEAFRESFAVLRRGIPEVKDVQDLTFSARALTRNGRSPFVASDLAILPNEFADREPELASSLQQTILDSVAGKRVTRGPAFMTSAPMGISRQDKRYDTY